MKEDKLKDIKPLIEIDDYSFYLYWGLVMLGILLLLIIGYVIYQKVLKNRPIQTRKAHLEALDSINWPIQTRKAHLEALDSINWSTPKHAAYKATLHGRELCTNDRTAELYSQMLESIEKYKYKKESVAVEDETLRAFELFRRVCHESV